jgi:ATP-binding protein involved in chromosome partitioning
MEKSQDQALDANVQARLAALTDGRATGGKLREGMLTVVLDVTGLDEEARAKMERALRAEAIGLPGVRDIRIALTAEKARPPRILAVGSGKGGVGKSTVATNLAVALQRLGLRVGMVDADVYGPSLPRLLSSEGVKPGVADNKLIPIPNGYGVPMLSMGHLVQPGQALAWRGPMAGNALGQLLDADWSGVDVIVVDLPPGTGDVQLTMIQRHKPAGAIIVSTPQDLALMDATRAISLFNQAEVPIIGLVENMAGYVCPHCGETSDPFGQGGAEAAAASMGLAFLGRIPLTMAVRQASDAGVPPASGDGPEAAPFRAIADMAARWLANSKPAG